MTNRILASLLLAAAFAVPSRLAAQGPDGSDINKAIPIYFGQTITDFLDYTTGHSGLVYSIVLSKGQTINITMTNSAVKRIGLGLFAPGTVNIGSAKFIAATGTGGSATFNSLALTYEVAASGTYYVNPFNYDNSSKFELQVTAKGTPISVPNPPSAGCLTGRVDYLTYSLQLIATGLADEVSIGSQRACATCTVKAPLYPEIVNRLELALRSKTNVEACYDSTGSIFQIKLVQP